MATSLGPIRHHTGTVLPSLMTRVLKVRTTKQTYNAFLQKHFLTHPLYHVADPTGSCNTGDVVNFIGPLSSVSKSENVKHVVTEIRSPWGKRVDERPALWDFDVWKKLTRGRQGRGEVLDRILGRKVYERKRQITSVVINQGQNSKVKTTNKQQAETEVEVDNEAESEPVWLKFKQRSMAQKEEVMRKDSKEEREEVVGQSREKRKEKDAAEEERRHVEKAESEGIVKEEEKAPEGKGTREEVLGSAAS